MERVKGIEPSSSAWKAEVLPLNYTRNIHMKLVPVAGVEPALQKEHDFESCASANSATPASVDWRRQPDLNR
ncbi:hypothetical protein BSG1_05774 [Bacillus sp. SG-1]|nr:hypothetical protein BSG1_05774 [Bacillus sp. SG-1]